MYGLFYIFVALISKSSGQLAELTVYIIPLVDMYSHQGAISI